MSDNDNAHAHTVHDLRYPSLNQATLAAVDWFACDMKRKLQENAHKGNREEGWMHTYGWDLYKRLLEEVHELGDAITTPINSTTYNEHIQTVIDEAADVGNFAMMLADQAREALRLWEARETQKAAAATNTEENQP